MADDHQGQVGDAGPEMGSEDNEEKPLDELKHSLVPALRFIMVLGAAQSDATPEQRRHMNDRIRPLMEQFREDGNPKPIIDQISATLGQDWRPSGEWAEFLKGLK